MSMVDGRWGRVDGIDGRVRDEIDDNTLLCGGGARSLRRDAAWAEKAAQLSGTDCWGSCMTVLVEKWSRC
jgi:hypothetical protein